MTSFDNEEFVEGFRLTVDFRALDHIERMAGKLMPEILSGLFDTCPLSLKTKVIKGLMFRHHPKVTLDQALAMLFRVDGQKLFSLIQRTFNVAKERPENPLRRRGTSVPSSPNGLRSAALLPSSGGNRHDPMSFAWKVWPAPLNDSMNWLFQRLGILPSSRSMAMVASFRI